ncbi:unnamed protein product [Linum trigynum]|uniref:Uncharacterized protein n=1 Tax=Linum trigynum TaxID=586398 RepID=A0AAV2CEA2_9ROSI
MEVMEAEPMTNRKSKKKRIELGISCMLNTEVSSVLAVLRRPTADPTAAQFLSQEKKKLRHRAVGAGEPSLITRDLLGDGGGGSTSSAVGESDGNEFQELDLDVCWVLAELWWKIGSKQRKQLVFNHSFYKLLKQTRP